jgi:hypothetical protein
MRLTYLIALSKYHYLSPRALERTVVGDRNNPRNHLTA